MHKYSRMVFARQDFLFPAETQRRRELYHKKPFVLFRASRAYNYPQYLSAPLNLLCLRVSLKATASATTTLIRVTPFIRVYSCKSVYAQQAKALATNPCTKRLLQTNQFRSSPYSIVVLIFFYLIIIVVLKGARNGSTAPT